MGSKGGGGQVAGYEYSLDMLMGLCRGPLDEIKQINVGDLEAWSGSVTDNGSFQISAPDLFGGDQKEGGVAGGVDVMMGAPDQDTTGSNFRAAIGGLLSDLRGVATMYFSGLICANNPYPKKWTVRVRRALKGWHGGTAWYPAEAVVLLADANGNVIKAMNGAHIVYECMTNPVWGRGLPTDALDEPSFINAANTLCREEFGLCMLWDRSTELSAFVQNVLNHIGGALYPDRTTGLIVLHLLRKDYVVDDLPIFDYASGLMEITDDQTTAPDNSHSEIIVNWLDPVANSQRQTRVQNLAGTQANQTVVSVKTDYLGIPTAGIAARVAQRDLQVQGTGIKRYTLKFDRRGRKIAPSGVFRINVPDRGINNMVLRAGKVEEGPINQQTITVTAVQDVFGLETTTYLAEPERAWVSPDRSVQSIVLKSLQEANYRELVRSVSPADLATVAVDSGDVVSVAVAPTPASTAYELWTMTTGEAFADHGKFVWTPTAQLSNSVGYYDTSFPLSGGVNLSKLVIPSVAWVGSELVNVTAYDSGTGILTVGRGCVDTIPAPHGLGTRIWFPENAAGADGRDYTSGEVVSTKLLTRTNIASQALGDVVADDVTIVGRQGKPYPPGNFQINGVPFANVVADDSADIVFTWTHRDRVTQSDHVLVHGDVSTGPETGVTYTVQIYDDTNTLVRTTTAIAAATWTYTNAMYVADGSPISIAVHLKAVRSGIDSLQTYVWPFFRVLVGYGRSYGIHYG